MRFSGQRALPWRTAGVDDTYTKAPQAIYFGSCASLTVSVHGRTDTSGVETMASTVALVNSVPG